jgi:NitT/TauT family transport system substrate-binding protein
MVSVRKLVLSAAASAVALAASAAAAAPFQLKIACTATSDCASAMVARDEGLFAKHGLDVDMALIGINTNIPPAIVSDSIQVGGPTATVFLQAIDGGLDLVAIDGGSVMSPEADGLIAAVARKGVAIKTAKDFVGKKVGAPGIGAFLDVLFRKWLIDNGVDPKDVHFVEVTFPTMSDALKSGSVDAVLTAEPFVTRIEKAGNGEVAARYALDLHATAPIIPYVATRSFAEAHPDVIKAFREAIAEGATIVNADHDKAAESVSKFTKMPLEIVKLNPPSLSHPALKGSDFDWWITTMSQLGMLQTKIDSSELVLP